LKSPLAHRQSALTAERLAAELIKLLDAQRNCAAHAVLKELRK